MEHKDVSDINNSCSPWDNPKETGGGGGLVDLWKVWKYFKSPEELRRLALSQISVKITSYYCCEYLSRVVVVLLL